MVQGSAIFGRAALTSVKSAAGAGAAKELPAAAGNRGRGKGLAEPARGGGQAAA